MSDTPTPPPTNESAETQPKRCGFVALIGEPNAGKSTLMNHMIGAKLAIVTHKVQTTRTRIRGVAIEGESQIIFVDTPGLFRSRRRLDRAMVNAAWEGVADADITLLLVEAHRGLTSGVEMILQGLVAREGEARRIALVINKIDKVKADQLLALTAELNARAQFDASFMISAEHGYGTKELRAYLAAHLPQEPWYYPEDQLGDMPLRQIAAEMTREKLMLRLHQELPYNLTVETESWQERKDGSVRIDQTIYVTREGHRGITLGPKGETIKAISMAARAEISAFIERPVHLFLQVKLRPNWQEEPERYREMGLDFSNSNKS